MLPILAERSGASVLTDVKEIVSDRLRMSDVFVSIVARRYGLIREGSTKSLVHFEYEEAKRLGLPCMVFLADPWTESSDSSDALFPASVRNLENRAHLQAYRHQLQQENVPEYFSTPDDLGRHLAIALHHYMVSQRIVLRPIDLFSLEAVAPERIASGCQVCVLH